MNDLSVIFKAYDVRGRVGDELNDSVVTRIGRAMASWLPQDGPVAVGCDMRPDSRSFALAMIEGLKQQGRDVWDIGDVTTDMIYFTVGHYKLAGGAMITASHNPGEYNGIKLCREEAKPIGEETGLLDIRDAVMANKFATSKNLGTVEQKDVVEAWIDHVLGFIDTAKLKPLKLVVDAGNGMAGKIFPELEPYVPFEVTEMYFDLDGTFPNHIANPLEPKNLEDLIKEVRAQKADVGLAFDGDGDRAVLIDENGEPLSGTVMTALLAEYFLDLYPGSTILHNAITGQVARDTIIRCGGKPVRTKVGHSFIKNDMRKYGGLFAGEHSGHYYFADNFMADSGLIAAIIGLALLSNGGKKLSELVAPYRKYHSISETNFEVADKQATMQKIAKAYGDVKADWLDGLTLAFDDGWVNVRPSNTEPLLRLNVEARTKDKLDNYVNKITQLIVED